MSAPFRITRRSLINVSRGTEDDLKDYLGRLTKLIPTEVISLYLVGRSITEDDKNLLIFWTIFCLLGVILVRSYGTADPKRNLPPQLTTVLIACISFTIWIYSMGDIFSVFNIYYPRLGSLLVLSWTFVVPFIYKGEREI